MGWAAAIASILGTSGITALITGITVPRSEARRLRAEIAANKVAANDLGPGSEAALVRAMYSDAFRLASITLVRFERWASVLSGLVAIAVVVIAGVALVIIGSPSGRSIEVQVTRSFKVDPLASTLVAVGTLIAGIAIGIAVAFLRNSALASARTSYVRKQLADLYGTGITPAEQKFWWWLRIWRAAHAGATLLFFTED